MNAAAGAVREKQFRDAMLWRHGVTLERPRRIFRFRFTTYEPDFYSPSTDTYYEVVGSRQRGFALLPTFDLMATCHPEIKLEIVTPDGRPMRFGAARRDEWLHPYSWGVAMTDRMRREGLRWRDVAAAIGIAYGDIYRWRRQPGFRRAADVAARLEAFALGRDKELAPSA